MMPTKDLTAAKDPPMTAGVAAVFRRYPDHARATLLQIRQLIFETAIATQTAPVQETLKWGEPAYLPAKKHGTTIRLGASDTHAALFVHCQTTLLDQYRERFPTEFTYEGNRAVRFALDAKLNSAALAQIIALALTYHKNRRAKR